MKTIERVMRVMTQVNIGAAIGMVAWVMWSGHQVVSGDWPLPPRNGPAAAGTPPAARQPMRAPVPERPDAPRAWQQARLDRGQP